MKEIFFVLWIFGIGSHDNLKLGQYNTLDDCEIQIKLILEKFQKDCDINCRSYKNYLRLRLHCIKSQSFE